jgi:hypothetical protein
MAPNPPNRIRIELIDSLGTVTFNKPDRYDTSITWVHHSDCGKPCDEQKYRFQSKNNPILKESGWGWFDDRKDSIDQFTISHSSYLPVQEDHIEKDSANHKIIKQQLLYTRQAMSSFDTLIKINNRMFSFFQFESADSVYRKEIIAITTFRGIEIKFVCEFRSTRNDSTTRSFMNNSISLIHSIVIGKSF